MIVLGSPYRSNDPRLIVGPFKNKDEAGTAIDTMIGAGQMEDGIYATVPLVDLATYLEDLELQALEQMAEENR